MATYSFTDAQKQDIVNRVNASDARFVQRLKDPNRQTLDLGNGQIGTHKMSWGTTQIDGKETPVIYPEIQEIDGKLVDMSGDPKAAFDSAMKNKNYVPLRSNDEAEWFTADNYKAYYPSFQQYVPKNTTTTTDDGSVADEFTDLGLSYLKPRVFTEKMPDESDYNYYQRMASQFAKPEVSEEERSKRLRAAQQLQVLDYLSKGINAFVNLNAVNNGAFSQKPEEDKDDKIITDWIAKQDKEKETAKTQKIAAMAKDYEAYKDAYKNWLARKLATDKYNEEVTKFNAKAENDYKNARTKAEEQSLLQDKKDAASQKRTETMQQGANKRTAATNATKRYTANVSSSGGKDHTSTSVTEDEYGGKKTTTTEVSYGKSKKKKGKKKVAGF